MANGVTVPQKCKHFIILWYSNFTSEHLPQRIESRNSNGSSADPCSQHHYSQESKGRINLGVHCQINE